MIKYKVTAEIGVAEDLKSAKVFLNSRRSGYGIKFLSEYREMLKTLEKNPDFQIRYNNIRCLPFKTFNYMIHFKVNETERTIHIFAVISTYLNPEQHWI